MCQIKIPDIGEMSSQKLHRTNSSVKLGFMRLIKCRRSFILRVRFHSIRGENSGEQRRVGHRLGVTFRVTLGCHFTSVSFLTLIHHAHL